MFNFRRKEIPWEVVDSKGVDPVPMYDEDEDLDIVAMSEGDTRGTYVFEVKHAKRTPDLRSAIIFARQQFMQEVIKKGYNVLLLESWRLTLYRKGKQHRVEVQYHGRGARALGKLPPQQPPPFIAILQSGL